MLNSRQRAQLRGLANGIETIFQIGKGGIGEQLIKQVDEALEARELIKLCVLESAPESSRIAADTIAPAVKADVVQVIGRRFILYRPSTNKENRKIVLVK
ncbi:MAG: ribosome assembly RNA-binding protein YhbY [Ruminococcaceae bacterium]|nr:ribosome assembly RNA-binding protein YhbY [Oscillospiraceae bacterium]